MMASGEIRLSGTMPRQMPVLAQSGDPTTAQSPASMQSANSPPIAEIVVTATQMSNAAGWTGVGALIADPASSTWSIGTNMLIYPTASGNQYFRTLARVSTVFKSIGAGAVLVGTVADYFDAIDTGSFFQANLNAGIGAAGLFTPIFAPIYAIPGAIYFMASTDYPGGPAAYNAAFSEAINAAGPLY